MLALCGTWWTAFLLTFADYALLAKAQHYLPVIVVVMLSSSSSVFMGSFCDTRPTRILYVTQDGNAVVLHVTPVTPPLQAEHRYAISTHTLERLYAALGVFNVNEQRRRKAGPSLR